MEMAERLKSGLEGERLNPDESASVHRKDPRANREPR